MNTKSLLTTLAIVAVVLITGCKKDEFVEKDGVCPEVVSTIPTSDASNVPINQIISVTFNEKMNPATINLATFSLTSGSKISGALTYDGTTPTFTFAPTAPLTPNTTYIGKVSRSVKDPMGNYMQADYVWSFTTAQTQYAVTLSSNPLAGGTTAGGGSFASGSSVTVTATPNAGYTFTNWTEGAIVASTSAAYTFTITGNRTLVANFAETIVNYTVTLSSNPLAGGTTTGGGTYVSGSSVTIGASPNTGYTFTNWTEGVDVVSTSATYTFTITGNRTLVANFAETINTYNVILSSNPLAGGITTGAGSYVAGTSVTVGANPNAGYVFTNWTEGGNVVSSHAGYTFTITGNRTLVANFTETIVTYTIALSSNPAAGGTTTGGGTFVSGSSVAVTATPNTGYNFMYWTEGVNVVSTDANYTFTIVGNRTLVANFAEIAENYTVTVSANPSAGGTATGGGSFTSGTSVTVTATPSTGYTFVNWTEGLVVVSSNAIYTFSISGNRTLVANFIENVNTFTLTVTAVNGSVLKVPDQATYLSGTSVLLTATPNSGYTFTGWSGDATGSDNPLTVVMNSNKNITANFTAVAVTYTLTVTAVNGSVLKVPDQATYLSGTSVLLTATPDDGYTFTSWSGDATGSGNPLTVVMNSNKNITANFTKNPVGPGVVNLGTAGDFAILTKSGISTTGTTSITGDIGVSPAAASAITGFSLIMAANNQYSTSLYVVGKVYAADYTAPTPAKMSTAVSDMETAYTAANGLVNAPIVEYAAGNLNGQTLAPGLYKWGTGVSITTGITLAGGPNDTWVFQVAQDLTVNNGAIITLSGGAQVSNIVWVVAGQAVLGTNVDFSGIILSQTLISLNTGAKVTGRLLAQTAVTLIASTIIQP